MKGVPSDPFQIPVRAHRRARRGGRLPGGACGFTPVAGTADTYTISTHASGQCVDVYGASAADNATIIQWTCHNGMNQQWRLVPVTVSGTDKTFNLVSVASGKCVAPSGASSASNTGLVQLPCGAGGGAVCVRSGPVRDPSRSPHV
ncbi:RICIN domain-containing protein [Streptomyces scabichelini]|uniref:RICIN domain-containing protein n=1 Tax=Streptomyces scabichelini TaxID=2711217 RepID=UPI001F496DB0|nr:RICIN domain-containing protein [Streptomyces scabichelini]